ncbi:MAG: hypothetical protein NT076_03770 [Candidatus Pacearchaeota archaeon]|nr:hypothetical protein [Candidatus Pacearchaeota archaeon]
MTKNKNPEKVKMGKSSRAKGGAFERRVREYLEAQGWICGRWSNNVSAPFEADIGEWERKLEPAKRKFNPFLKALSFGTGFPDLQIYREVKMQGDSITTGLFPGRAKFYEIIGIEIKSGKGGYLDKEEKEKVRWLMNKGIFSKFFVAMRDTKRRGEIIFKEYSNEIQ